MLFILMRIGIQSHEHIHILVQRGKVLEDALREVRKDRFDPTKLLNVSSCNFIE